MDQTGIIILAAGSSSRLGQPKQLLQYGRQTLLSHLVQQAVKAGLHPVIIVLGANADQVSLTLKQEEVMIVHNDLWQEGMASGIVAGIKKLLSFNATIKRSFISVCDQPLITADLFMKMIAKKQVSRKGIVACSYADTIGTPVLFDQKYFEALQQLKGTEGAKRLIKLNEKDVVAVSFPQGNIDIDAMEDYTSLLTSDNNNKIGQDF